MLIIEWKWEMTGAVCHRTEKNKTASRDQVWKYGSTTTETNIEAILATKAVHPRRWATVCQTNTISTIFIDCFPMYGNDSFADGCVLLVGFDDGNSPIWVSCNSDCG